MTRAFGDDRLELELRAVLHERAEEMASRAHTTAEMTAEITRHMRWAGVRAARQEAILRLATIALLVLALLLAAIAFGARPTRPPMNLLLAVDLSLQGEPAAPPIVDAIRLALSEAAGPDGVTIDLPRDGVFNDSVDGKPDAQQGAENMRRIAADPRYVAVIGPFHSFVAETEIPIANAAGILECSPSNTAPGLTVGVAAASIRPRLDRPSYVRVAVSDNAAAEAAARLLVGALGKRSVFVVSTVAPWAGGRSETFIGAFKGLGGALSGRGAIGEGGDPPRIVAEQIRASGADSVFFDGPASDGARVLAALSTVSADLPFVGLDIILDGPRSAKGSFLEVAGAEVGQAFGVFPAGTDPELGRQVQTAYEAAYGHGPENYVLSGYACTQVILDAIERLDASRLADPGDWREAIRAEVTAPGRRYRTAVGTIGFDPNGDAEPQRVSIYRADATIGDWTFWQMVELTPGG
jgi:branched-chain amino acid transport system substrate-binding protein